MLKFDPEYLEVINESDNHHVPENSETHFRVIIVSQMFKGISLIKQHMLVNETLDEFLKKGVHALAIVTRTPEAWKANQEKGVSPNCLGKNTQLS